MRELLLLGAGLGFTAAIQPGPTQAFLVSRVALAGWRRTLPAAIAPPLADIPIALLVLLVLGQIPPTAQHALRLAGGLLMLTLAWRSLRSWRRPEALALPPSPGRNLRDAMLVNILNPNPWLGWALVLGPLALDAWRERPAAGFALVAAFYGAMITTLLAFIALVGTVSFLGSRAQRGLVGASAVVLAAIGVVLLVLGARGLAG